MTEPTMIVATPEQLRAMLRAAVEEVLAERERNERELVYLDVAQAAELVGVHPRTLRKLIATDGLPGVRVGQLWRFPRHELIAWLERRRGAKPPAKAPTPPPAPSPIRALRKTG